MPISAPGVRQDANTGINQQAAILGYWRDCNDDKFIGNAITGASDYRAALGVNTTRCPSGSPYNDGTYIHEFRPIGPSAAGNVGLDSSDPTSGAPVGTASGLPYAVNDNGARVWMDYGRPTDRPGNPGTPVFPWPVGTLDSAGSFIAFLDTLAGASRIGFQNGTWNTLNVLTQKNPAINSTRDIEHGAVAETIHAAYYQTVVHSTEQFTQTRLVRSGYNDSTQANDPGHPIVKAWDCDQHNGAFTPGNGVTPQTNGDIVGSVNPSGSLEPTLIYNTGFSSSGNCKYSAHSVEPFQNLEAGSQVVPNGKPKITSDVNFQYSLDVVQTSLLFAGVAPSGPGLPSPGHIRDPTGTLNGEPALLGLAPDGLSTALGEGWVGDVGLIGGGFDGTLGGGSRIWTYYAYVSVDGSGRTPSGALANTALPGGATPYTYGSEACGATAGQPNAADAGGWACDATKWAPSDQGSSQPYCFYLAGESATDTCAHVGDPYNLRDTDCIDGSVSVNRATGQNTAVPDFVVHSPTGAASAPADPVAYANAQTAPVCRPYAGA